jgi:hypothetical protein
MLGGRMPVSRSVQFPQGYGAVRTRPGARGPVSPQSANGGSLITGLHRGRASAHIRAPVSGLKCGMTITQSLSTKITLPCASYGDAAPLSHYDQLAVSNNPIHYIPLPPQHQRRHVTKMHEEPIPYESTEIVVSSRPLLPYSHGPYGRTKFRIPSLRSVVVFET